MKYFIIYIITINIVTLIIYGVDKKKAIKGKWRVSEAKLITCAVIGGSIGAYVGMQLFHHKTKKAKFAVGVPAIFIIQAILAMYILQRIYKLQMNRGTFITASILIIVVVVVIAYEVKRKKSGKGSCGGDCSHCRGCK